MKDLSSKFKPVLTKEGVLYSPPGINGVKCTIILEEVDRKARFTEDYMNNEEKVLGFNAWHKLTGDPYYFESLISKKIGKPGIYVIMQVADRSKPVDYASNLESAKEKAHYYILNEILREVLKPEDVYTNLLDKTKIGKERFEKMNKNEANLSANIRVRI